MNCGSAFAYSEQHTLTYNTVHVVDLVSCWPRPLIKGTLAKNKFCTEKTSNSAVLGLSLATFATAESGNDMHPPCMAMRYC